jgi:hypothetical protein
MYIWMHSVRQYYFLYFAIFSEDLFCKCAILQWSKGHTHLIYIKSAYIPNGSHKNKIQRVCFIS